MLKRLYTFTSESSHIYEKCYNIEFKDGEIEDYILDKIICLVTQNKNSFIKYSFTSNLITKYTQNDIITIGPRRNFPTSWSINALSILKSSNIDCVSNIEISHRYVYSIIYCCGCG